jgi:hypothetical protein
MIPVWAYLLGGIALFLWLILPRMLAQKKGYTSYPWTTLGGPISVLVLLLLPNLKSDTQGAISWRFQRRYAQAILISLLLLGLAGACIAGQLLVPNSLDSFEEPRKAFWLATARTLPTDAVLLMGGLLAFRNRKRCAAACGLAGAALLLMLTDHLGMHALVAWWNSVTVSTDLEDQIYVVRMESTIHTITAISYGIWTFALAMLILAVFIGRSQWSPRRNELVSVLPPPESEAPVNQAQSDDTRICRKV